MLRSARAGFSQGCRNHAALVYAFLLRCSGVPKANAAAELGLLGAECHPPLGLAPCMAAIKTAFGRRFSKLCDQTISDWLDITPEESQILPGRMNGHRLPAASRFGAKAAGELAAGRAKDTRRDDRRAMILRLVNHSGRVPPSRAMARLLSEMGFPVGFVQVSKDYKALRLKSQRSKTSTNSPKSVHFNFL